MNIEDIKERYWFLLNDNGTPLLYFESGRRWDLKNKKWLAFGQSEAKELLILATDWNNARMPSCFSETLYIGDKRYLPSDLWKMQSPDFRKKFYSTYMQIEHKHPKSQIETFSTSPYNQLEGGNIHQLPNLTFLGPGDNVRAYHDYIKAQSLDETTEESENNETDTVQV